MRKSLSSLGIKRHSFVTITMLRITFTSLFCLALAACSIQRTIPLQSEDAARIRSIALVQPAEPTQFFLLAGEPTLAATIQTVDTATRVAAPSPPHAAAAAAIAIGTAATIDVLRAESAIAEVSAVIQPTNVRLAGVWNHAFPQFLESRGLRTSVLPPGSIS